MSSAPSTSTDIRQQLRDAIAHFEHVLPGQASIKDFVHHNTLHGFQHLPFAEAIEAARRITGHAGYPSLNQFRAWFANGRITLDDLVGVLDDTADLDGGPAVFEVAGTTVTRRDIHLAALLHPFKPVTACQLSWQVEELGALTQFQHDVPPEARSTLLERADEAGSADETAAISDLWSASLAVLGLERFIYHPEEMVDMSADLAEALLGELHADAEDADQPLAGRLLQKEAQGLLRDLLDRVGQETTLRGLMQALVGVDIMDDIRPLVGRLAAAHLDLGVAAWSPRDRDQGLYRLWKRLGSADIGWIVDDMPDWRDHLHSLPDDPMEAVIAELRRLGLPRAKWVGYIERLALELPGWSGMFLWRHRRPGYAGTSDVQVDMIDYLALRLVLERLFAQRICRREWNLEPNIDVLRWHFRRNPSEFLVRYTLFNSRLPEYLSTLAQRFVQAGDLEGSDDRWQEIARLIWTWRHSPAGDRPAGYGVYRHAWPLFRLSQHLAVPGTVLRKLDGSAVAALFSSLEELTPERMAFIWLQAYERHYRDEIFTALAANHDRGRWATRSTRPSAQVVFCMDDREEGIRRHLEESAPDIETMGAAGFFGVAINWRGLDDRDVTPLCPVVVVPSHEIREQPKPQSDEVRIAHEARRRWRLRLADFLVADMRRDLVGTALGSLLAAPLAVLTLGAKLLAPGRTGETTKRWRTRFDLSVPTDVAITATDASAPATPEHPRLGFTDNEQADRVQGFLRTIGLQSGFAPLVVMMGHGSSSENNPHRAAYDCGACSGRHGGPNARVFAAMANRPEVRAILRARGLVIPDDCRFVGAFHNTCNEAIDWYDLDTLPDGFADALEALRAELDLAAAASAHERCRRLASAPRNPDLPRALAHIRSRATDFSQARPELGHATNATAFIGRRSATQGAFFDRRMFLISYDPTGDEEGKVLEAILLAAGPVGAGINLEYYFSTVNNEEYGCGSKVTHNLTGYFGVMEGTASDLRTGLPRQMIEIHEPMRLQVICEADTETLTRIYERQPPLQELVGNGWLLLSTKDPDTPTIHVFDPARGWKPWTGDTTTVARTPDSPSWYRGHSGPLPPALVDQPEAPAHG